MPANPLTPHTEFVLRMFLTDGQARNLRPRTIEYYRTQLTWFLGYVAQSGGATVEDITPYLVRAYLVYLQQERRWADASIHTAARAIRAFFKFLEAEGLIQESPMRRVKMPKADKSVKTPFTVDELRRLLAAAGSRRDRAIIYCLLDSGCRISEFAGWRYGDIDFQTGAVHLGASSTKGRRSRVVYLGAKARRELLKWLTTFKSIDRATPIWQSETDRKPLTAYGVTEVVKRLGRRAKVKPCGPHRFRHTFAVSFLKNGGDVFALQNLMGHAGLEMTRRYIHLVDTDLQAAHAKFGVVDRL